MTKAERIERANRVCQHIEGKPQFRYNPHGGALELSFTGRHRISGMIETATRTVIVNRTTGMLSTQRIDPWGSTASRALALLAGWIRTGKIGVPLSWWEGICKPPVLLGYGGLLEAVKREIFEGEHARSARCTGQPWGGQVAVAHSPEEAQMVVIEQVKKAGRL